MNTLKKQAGFTLIELVIVIVILGILAATAAPKFIDLTGDARGSTVDAVRGALNSAADLAHSKALVKGVVDGDISISGSNITFVNSWPNNASIAKLIDLDTSGDLLETTGTAGTFTHKSATTAADCVAVYEAKDATTDTRPSITSTITGC